MSVDIVVIEYMHNECTDITVERWKDVSLRNFTPISETSNDLGRKL